MFKTTTSGFNSKKAMGNQSFGKFNIVKELDPYAFNLTDEMKFTEDDIIRMNITLGITGDMFRSHGVFYTDFMLAEHQKKKKIQRQLTGKTDDPDSDEDDPEDNEEDFNNEKVDPNKQLMNSMKPNYLKTAIQKDKHL